MKPLEFLADVLPSPGHGLYCVAELSTRKKNHQFIATLEEIKPHVKQWLGKKYNKALSAFLDKTGLNQFATPHVLSSGGGLHCYWPLDKESDIETWKPIAENLKRLCRQEGMQIDMAVTADAARVLRIPGTFNFKDKYPEPRPVKMMIQGSGAIDLLHFGAPSSYPS